MKKIKWNNIFKTILFIAALLIVLNDIYWIFISQFFTGYLASWTYFGFITFGFSLYYLLWFCEEFENYMKK